MVLVVEIL